MSREIDSHLESQFCVPINQWGSPLCLAEIHKLNSKYYSTCAGGPGLPVQLRVNTTNTNINTFHVNPNGAEGRRGINNTCGINANFPIVPIGLRALKSIDTTKSCKPIMFGRK